MVTLKQRWDFIGHGKVLDFMPKLLNSLKGFEQKSGALAAPRRLD